jgi:UDP-glucose 4-epimerase
VIEADPAWQIVVLPCERGATSLKPPEQGDQIKMRVLVTGGAGYIGSVVSEELMREGHEVVVYDNLYNGHLCAVAEGAPFILGDLNDGKALSDALKTYAIEAVIHLAADSQACESTSNPSKYYRNNLMTGLSLLDSMRECGVGRIIFSSTAAVYGETRNRPVRESDHASPASPFGESKLAFERALEWYGKAYGICPISLRHFNTAGASRRCGESHEPETHLIPVALQVAAGRRKFVDLYGSDYPTPDGTCVRDYVHVVDLARAYALALRAGSDCSGAFNIGCGAGYSVREVIEAAREVTGMDIPVRECARRAGDPAVLIADGEKSQRELGWKPVMLNLREIIMSAWVWMIEHPYGYERSAFWMRAVDGAA